MRCDDFPFGEKLLSGTLALQLEDHPFARNRERTVNRPRWEDSRSLKQRESKPRGLFDLTHCYSFVEDTNIPTYPINQE